MNNRGKRHKNLKVRCSLIFVSGKKAILSNERRSCFHNESHASGDRVQCLFLSDRSSSRHLLYTNLVKGSNFALVTPM